MVKFINFFFNDDKGFSFIFRPSEAEHPNQKSQLKGLLLTKEEAYTYLLSKEAHTIKTTNIDLIKPETIDKVSNWFRFNGQCTVDFLKTLWESGKLEDSVECFDLFEIAIKECVEEDLASFEKKGIPDTAIDFAGQIRGTAIGSNDLDRLGESLANTPREHLDEGKCVALLKRVIKKSKMRAAYIQEGLHQFPVDSPAHCSQDYQSKKFMNNINLLIETAASKLPSLLTNPEFIENYEDFLEILQGKGNFQKLTSGKDCITFKASLNNPKAQLNLVARSFNINKYKII